MDDMNVFERQLAEESLRIAGPSRPVNDAAIFTAITATQSPKWRFRSMFSATKFVLAGAIVALFGGFLLAGVLTQPSEDVMPAVGASASAPAEPTEGTAELEPVTEADGTTIRSDLLPGVDLVTEEVEPGVYRVDHDGVRALDAWNGTELDRYNSVVAGVDGSVWLIRMDSFFRIGDGETYPWFGSDYDNSEQRDDFEVAPDGTLWWAGASGKQGLRSFDGERWAVRMAPPLWGVVREVEIEPDGTVWAAWVDDSTEEMSVSRLAGDEWQTTRTWQVNGEFHGLSQFLGPKLSVADAGQVWVLIEGDPDGDAIWRLADRAGGEWELLDGSGLNIGRMEVTPAGTAWASNHGLAAGRDRLPTLARFDGADWIEYPSGVGGTRMQWVDHANQARLKAAPDGSVWAATFLSDEGGCNGLMNFDGSTARTFMAGQCIHDFDVAPDGSVWVQDGGEGARGKIYVIAAEVVAGTE